MRRFSILTLVVVAGCGTRVLDPTKAENSIRTGITKLGAQVQSVKCPSGVKVGKGIVSHCTATMQTGETVPIKATQIDNKGDVHFVSTTMIAAVIENMIDAKLRRLGIAGTATCTRHVPIVAGSKLTCTVRDPAGHSVHVQVAILNLTGAFKLDGTR